MSDIEKKNIVLDSSLTAREKYRMLFGEDVSRDRARHAIDKLKHQFVVDNGGTVVGGVMKSVVNGDGTGSSEAVLDCSEEQLRDPVYLLRAHGYDPSRFILVSSQSSVWNGACDGGRMYSSRIKVKPCGVMDDPVGLIENALAAIGTGKCEHGKPVYELHDSEKMLEVCLADLHIGLSEERTGLDYLHDQVMMKDVMYDTVRLLKENGIGNCTLAFLGDLLHYDTAGRTTTSGTQQCSNEPFQVMYNRAVTLVVDLVGKVVETLEGIAGSDYQLNIVYVPGNHDRLLGYTVMCVLRTAFSGKARFIVDQTDHKLLKYGCNLIGYVHGDMPKGRVSQWVYNEGRPYLKDVDEIEVHCGHLHSEQVVEENGMIVRHLPTLAGVSPWEYRNGYVSTRRIAAFIWDKEYGLKSINYIGV